jgi:hypothetical protein
MSSFIRAGPLLCAVALTLLFGCRPAAAQTHNEVEDAPSFGVTGQGTDGSGSLTNIRGSLVNAGAAVDQDLYAITITNYRVFSARSDLKAPSGAASGVLLSLYSADHTLLGTADFLGLTSFLGHITNLPLTQNGEYYIGISSANGSQGNYNVTLNGAAFRSAPSVAPEPGSALLLMPGLAAFGLFQLRRRKYGTSEPVDPTG